MKSLSEVKGRCRITDTGCWIWTGAATLERPNVTAPDYTRHAGKQVSQTGRRAVYHLMHRKPIPEGYRLFSIPECKESRCVNPAHAECLPTAEKGRRRRESGEWRGSVKRITSVRRVSRTKTRLTPELVRLIQQSDKTIQQLSRELGINRTTVSKTRRGLLMCFEPVGGMFTGLFR